MLLVFRLVITYHIFLRLSIVLFLFLCNSAVFVDEKQIQVFLSVSGIVIENDHTWAFLLPCMVIFCLSQLEAVTGNLPVFITSSLNDSSLHSLLFVFVIIYVLHAACYFTLFSSGLAVSAIVSFAVTVFISAYFVVWPCFSISWWSWMCHISQ